MSEFDEISTRDSLLNDAVATGSSTRWAKSNPLELLNEKKLQLLSEGRDIVDLSMFNPDFSPPRFAIDKLLEFSVRPGMSRYAVSRGVRRLREAFSEKYSRAFAISVDPEKEVCVTFGTKDAINAALRACAQPGDGMLVCSPTYPAHLAAARQCGLQLITVPLPFWAPASSHRFEEELLTRIGTALAGHSIRVLLLNFPNNPTGAVVTTTFWERLSALLAGMKVIVINDFVYGELCFGATGSASSLTALGLHHRTLESYTLSKAYSVPGWRVGALVGSPELIREVTRFKAFADYGLFLPLQLASAALLSQNLDTPGQTAQLYARRLSILREGLRRLGWECGQPMAGGCLWARIPEKLRIAHGDSISVSLWMLSELGIAALPGKLFGDGYDEWLRFAVVATDERLREVADRLTEGWQGAHADL